VIAPHVKMEATAMHMVIIRIHVLVHPIGMDPTVSMPTVCLHALITHALITEYVIQMVPMDFIVLVPMELMVSSVSTFMPLLALLRLVYLEEHVLMILLLHLTIVHVPWVITDFAVRPIRVKQHVLLFHVKT